MERIVINGDYIAVTYVVNTGSSMDTNLTKLLRSVFYLTAHYNLEIWFCQNAGNNNMLCNALSILNVIECLNLKPVASNRIIYDVARVRYY
jgi:hypothetical protein